MLCQNCNKSPANIHLTKVVNDERLDIHLCEKCAQENGQTGFDHPFTINNFLAGLLDLPSYPLGGTKAKHEAVFKCKVCGMTFEEFRRSGKLGCGECYNVFSEKLTPILKRLHGSDNHSGKLPHRTGGIIKVKKEIDRLKSQLNKAVRDEEYEKAAELRDRIRELEKNAAASGR